MRRTSRRAAVRDFTAESVLPHDPVRADTRTHTELRHERPPQPKAAQKVAPEPETKPKTNEKRKR